VTYQTGHAVSKCSKNSHFSAKSPKNRKTSEAFKIRLYPNISRASHSFQELIQHPAILKKNHQPDIPCHVVSEMTVVVLPEINNKYKEE